MRSDAAYAADPDNATAYALKLISVDSAPFGPESMWAAAEAADYPLVLQAEGGAREFSYGCFLLALITLLIMVNAVLVKLS
eukprot:SAG31_NODE_1949_length_6833_cov_4.354024_11_plen_81_part_00